MFACFPPLAGLRRFRANYAMSGEGRLVAGPRRGETGPRRITTMKSNKRRVRLCESARRGRSRPLADTSAHAKLIVRELLPRAKGFVPRPSAQI